MTNRERQLNPDISGYCHVRGKVPEVLFDFSILTDPSEGADFVKIQNSTENSITLTL